MFQNKYFGQSVIFASKFFIKSSEIIHQSIVIRYPNAGAINTQKNA
jgi:hypothetical protein